MSKMANEKIEGDVQSMISSMIPSRKAGAIVVAAVIGGSILSKYMKKDNQNSKSSLPKKENRFRQRIKFLLPIIIPKFLSVETGYIVALAIALSARTGLSGYISELMGISAQYLVTKRWKEALNTITLFLSISIPAAVINSGLKYLTTMLSLRFRVNLSKHLHDKYLNDVTFYNICHLGGRIDNVDQRITADIQKFSTEISSLYTSIFKPILDILLFTYKLTQVTGWQGPTIIYSYFVVSGFVKKFLMPSFGRLAEKESKLEGDYRNSHQRLIANSEEVAFYDGSLREKTIINGKLDELNKHVSYVSLKRAFVSVLDNLLVKYWATIAGYLTMYAPLIFGDKSALLKSTEELTRDYARNGRYLSNLSEAIGQIVLLGNKLSALSGYTARVGELFEKIDGAQKNVHFDISPVENDTQEYTESNKPEDTSFLKEWKERCDKRSKRRQKKHVLPNGPVKIVEGETIQFEHIDIISPEGKLLISDLCFTVEKQQNVMVTGPNGAGKSSLFRIIGDLWPPHAHQEGAKITKSPEIVFVPQKPYLVLGTLRDQIIYPHSQQDMIQLGVTDHDLERLLQIVDPKGDILRSWKWDDIVDWFHALSGGQKQRVAMARLFYHRPEFAILDECTSAVSDEVEDKIYSTCAEFGITLFTVSHRKYLRKHHDYELRIEGRGGRWTWKKIEKKNEI